MIDSISFDVVTNMKNSTCVYITNRSTNGILNEKWDDSYMMNIQLVLIIIIIIIIIQWSLKISPKKKSHIMLANVDSFRNNNYGNPINNEQYWMRNRTYYYYQIQANYQNQQLHLLDRLPQLVNRYYSNILALQKKVSTLIMMYLLLLSDDNTVHLCIVNPI